jgi:hypothetical protein
MINEIVRYFDINSHIRPTRPVGKAAKEDTVELHWFPQWVALLLGVLIQPFFQGFRTTGHWSFASSWGWVLFALIASFILFPAIYRRAFDAGKPVIVLLAPIFTAGLGWESMLGTILKAATQAVQ